MIPLMRYHKKTRQFYVWIRETKRRKHFGTDATIARQRYAQWLAGQGGPKELPIPSAMTVADGCEAYRRFAVEKYKHDRGARHLIETALAAVVELYGQQPINSFKAKALRDVRDRLIFSGKRPRSRGYVNTLTKTIRKAWRWLGCEELVATECVTSICLVRALRAGEGGRELSSVTPPEPGVVEATLRHCPPVVAAMIQVQLLTGARPSEVCRMRWEQISQSPSQPIPMGARTVAALRCGETCVWVYSPPAHKTTCHGKVKVIPIGPRAQALIGTGDSGYVFLNAHGQPWNRPAYAMAITRACELAGIRRWGPNRLRHSAATELHEKFGLQTAAAVLGHAPTMAVTYIEQAIRLAAEAAAKVG